MLTPARYGHSAARSRRRRGASIVEFAMVAPLLVALVLGIIEFGRLFMVAQLAVNGSREGCRYVVQTDKPVADAKEYTKTYLAAAGVPRDAVTTLEVTYQVSEADPRYTTANGGWVPTADLAAVPQGTAVKLYLEVDWVKVTWLPSGVFVSAGTKVPGTTVMRKE